MLPSPSTLSQPITEHYITQWRDFKCCHHHYIFITRRNNHYISHWPLHSPVVSFHHYNYVTKHPRPLHWTQKCGRGPGRGPTPWNNHHFMLHHCANGTKHKSYWLFNNSLKGHCVLQFLTFIYLISSNLFILFNLFIVSITLLKSL